MAHLDLPSIKQVEHAQGAGRQMQLFFPQVPLQIWWERLIWRLLREATHSINLITLCSNFPHLAASSKRSLLLMTMSCGCEDAEISVHCWLQGLLPMFDCRAKSWKPGISQLTCWSTSLVHILVGIEGWVQNLSLVPSEMSHTLCGLQLLLLEAMGLLCQI